MKPPPKDHFPGQLHRHFRLFLPLSSSAELPQVPYRKTQFNVRAVENKRLSAKGAIPRQLGCMDQGSTTLGLDSYGIPGAVF